jgi:hypothetical protein
MMVRHPASAGARQDLVHPAALDVAASEVLVRIRSEYREMPGLCLTLLQARRLWALDESTCSRLLSNLVSEGYLRKSAAGYVKAS